MPFAVVMRSALAPHLGEQPRGRRRGRGRELELVAGVHLAGVRPRRHVHAAHRRVRRHAGFAERHPGRAPARPRALLGLLAGYLALWTWLQGGIIDRYARQRPTRAHGFAAASGVFFFRFLRLGVMAGIVYWGLFAYLHPWLFDERYADLTRGLDSERVAFAWRVAFYAVFGLLVVAANVAFDYARIRMVVEDRRSAVGGLAAAVRFILRRPGAVAGLWCANALVFLAAVAVWAFAGAWRGVRRAR